MAGLAGGVEVKVIWTGGVVVGWDVGWLVGSLVGCDVGSLVGWVDGSVVVDVGADVGAVVGAEVALLGSAEVVRPVEGVLPPRCGPLPWCREPGPWWPRGWWCP